MEQNTFFLPHEGVKLVELAQFLGAELANSDHGDRPKSQNDWTVPDEKQHACGAHKCEFWLLQGNSSRNARG